MCGFANQKGIWQFCHSLMVWMLPVTFGWLIFDEFGKGKNLRIPFALFVGMNIGALVWLWTKRGKS
jgi:hypothetical protein